MAAITYLFGRPQTSADHSFARDALTSRFTAFLVAGVAAPYTPPTGANFVVFGATSNFFALPNGTATVPAADDLTGASPELNPIIWNLDGVTSISLISSAAATVTMSWYK